MGGSRSTRLDASAPGDDQNLDSVERLPLAELYRAIDRTAELFRRDLERLDDRPVILPSHPSWPPIETAPEEISTVIQEPAKHPVASPVVGRPLPVAPGTTTRRARPRRHRWWLATLLLIPLLAAIALPGVERMRRRPAASHPPAAEASSLATMASPQSSAPGGALTSPVATPPDAPAPLSVVVTPAAAVVPAVATAPPPTATPPSPSVLAAQIAAEESALQSGTFEVLLDYGQGSRSSVIVRFDLGGAGKEKRLALTTTASGKTADPRIELLAIGDRTWQRQPDGTWGPAITQDGLWEQLQAYLPHIRGASDVTVARLGEVLILRWSDATRGADLELHVESSGGRPLRLQETIPATGMVMVVTYQGWNTPVSIGPPVP